MMLHAIYNLPATNPDLVMALAGLLAVAIVVVSRVILRLIMTRRALKRRQQ